ncbi:MAG TPA: cytochrome c [Steroidobacteraceae bacterium]|jgi:mono/diheme cytochrome c family protein|nr:cytochrome c [Steroidobacteraceae bacterium]
MITLLLAAGSAAVASADDSSFASVASLSNVSGEDIYSRICQGCHMPHGEGAVGAGHYPRLAGDPTLASWRYVALTVLQGRNNMPAFSAPPQLQWDAPTVHLSDAQVADVVNYVRSHFGNRYQERVTADDVARLPHPAAGAAP